jgi:hypothetical protein
MCSVAQLVLYQLLPAGATVGDACISFGASVHPPRPCQLVVHVHVPCVMDMSCARQAVLPHAGVMLTACIVFM